MSGVLCSLVLGAPCHGLWVVGHTSAAGFLFAGGEISEKLPQKAPSFRRSAGL